jgi:hypothetical protein
VARLGSSAASSGCASAGGTAGPFGSGAHREALDRLRFGLHALERAGLARSLGRDFVVRLGDDAVTPDLLVIDRSRLADLHEYYLDGPPCVAIEITLSTTRAWDHTGKRALFERAGVPEYWVLDPDAQQAHLWRLGGDGQYQAVVPDAQGVYRSTAIPHLALSLPHLWTMSERDWDQPWLPFLGAPPQPPLPPVTGRQPGELGWDALPFAPRIALAPTRLTFTEYLSWCPEAKFEALGGKTVIGGDEGTRRVLAMLLMGLGLVEVVKLAHSSEWTGVLARP